MDTFVLDQFDIVVIDLTQEDIELGTDSEPEMIAYEQDNLLGIIEDVGLKGDPGPQGPPGRDGQAQIPEVIDGGFF